MWAIVRTSPRAIEALGDDADQHFTIQRVHATRETALAEKERLDSVNAGKGYRYEVHLARIVEQQQDRDIGRNK
jgi:hypothetical protein